MFVINVVLLFKLYFDLFSLKEIMEIRRGKFEVKAYIMMDCWYVTYRHKMKVTFKGL